MNIDVQHDPRQMKFYSVIKGVEYSLEYNDISPKLWEFHCPFPPGNKKEREIQDYLIEYALYYMKRNNIQLIDIGSCEYISDFLTRRSELSSVAATK